MKNKVKALLFLLAMVLGLAYLYFFSPGTGDLFPRCPMRFFTNLSCPGCGSARAIHELLHFNLKKAFFLNPIVMLILPYLLYIFSIYQLNVLFEKNLKAFFIPPVAIWILFILFIGFGLIRNLPLFPFYLFKA